VTQTAQEIGTLLVAVRDNFEKAGQKYGKFGQWLKDAGIGRDRANYCMRLARPLCNVPQSIGGMSHTPEYHAYSDAKRRCTSIQDSDWKDYGGRGITFLFTSFAQFYAELGPRPTPQHSLDRKDNNGNYEPGNVRWATWHEQRLNQRKAVHNG